MRPLIGITCSYNSDADRVYINHPYVRAIEEAGGIPMPLPPVNDPRVVESYLELCGGFLFSGGGDVDPAFFQEEPHRCLGQVTPERDVFELTLAHKVMAAGKPILGICRGIQLLNIVAGGDLYQDLGSQFPAGLKHSQKAPRWYPTHTVSIVPGTRLSGVFPETPIRVNSFHHQGIRSVAPGLIVSGTSADGLVEAIEGAGPVFFLAVQWHPECMWEKDRRALSLFKAIVEASKR